jgi:hypothetical protein
MDRSGNNVRRLTGSRLNFARWVLAALLLVFGVALLMRGAAPGLFWAAFVCAAALASAVESDEPDSARVQGQVERDDEPARPLR